MVGRWTRSRAVADLFLEFCGDELVEFVGHSTSYVVRLESGPLRVRDAALPRFRRGDLVDVSLEPVSTVAYPV